MRVALKVTPLSLASRFMGLTETAGSVDNPAILAMLKLDASWPGHDEVPWCSAFLNYIAWLLDLPRSKSLAARSWLTVGQPVSLEDAEPGFDVVVLRRQGGPGPDVLDAPGHVGFFVDRQKNDVAVLGGNQANSVSVAPFDAALVLGVRRI